MKIKKPMSVKTPGAAKASGGATIADRFKIDTMSNGAPKASSTGAGTKVAFTAAFISLCLLGGIVWFMYQYFEFQKVIMVD